MEVIAPLVNCNILQIIPAEPPTIDIIDIIESIIESIIDIIDISDVLMCWKTRRFEIALGLGNFLARTPETFTRSSEKLREAGMLSTLPRKRRSFDKFRTKEMGRCF